MPRHTILMFSGGRDSTIAAARLAEAGDRLTLVTVTSGHLVGLDAVRARLAELRDFLASATWIHARQPLLYEAGDTSSCLPCHLAYAAVAAVVAQNEMAHRVAFGYAGYQSSWPEQTPEAVAVLRGAFERIGIELVLPVLDIQTKEAAINDLVARRLSRDALEQKCLLQKSHLLLRREQLAGRLTAWQASLDRVLSAPPPLEVLQRAEPTNDFS